MKICYTNFNTNNTRDHVTITGLQKNGVEIVEITNDNPGLKKFFNIYRRFKKIKNDYDLIFVGYTGNLLVIFLKFIKRKKIIFNALCSLYEGVIISRRNDRFSFYSIYYYLLDFITFHLSDLILVESSLQKQFLIKKYLIREEKIIVHYTGVYEKIFYRNSLIKKADKFTVLFRGKFLPESGVDTVIKAAKLLENDNIVFKILGHGFMQDQVEKLIDNLKPNNLIWDKNFIKDDDLIKEMAECHIFLGQMSSHQRLSRTIPHKAYEAMVLGLPYLTARVKGVMEILKENETCFCSNPSDPTDLALKIKELKSKPTELQRVANNLYSLYNKNYTAEILGQKLLEQIKKNV